MKKGIKKMTYLPDELEYRGNTYVYYSPKRDLRLNPIPPDEDYVEVQVLSKNLKGRSDLRGNQYEPTTHFMVLKESSIRSIVRQVLNEMEDSPTLIGNLIDAEWDDLYDMAREEPYASKIKSMLTKAYKDQDLIVALADNYEWSDGSNGFINFSDFDHWLSDLGYKFFADYPDKLFNFSISELKEKLEYNFASGGDDFERGERYRNFEYSPSNEFKF